MIRAVGLVEAAQDLHREEGIAAGLVVQVGDECVLGGSMEGHQAAERLDVETMQEEAQRAGLAAQIGERRRERVIPPDLVGPVRRDEENPKGSLGAHEVAQHEQERLRSPMDVVDDEDDRAFG